MMRMDPAVGGLNSGRVAQKPCFQLSYCQACEHLIGLPSCCLRLGKQASLGYQLFQFLLTTPAVGISIHENDYPQGGLGRQAAGVGFEAAGQAGQQVGFAPVRQAFKCAADGQ